MDAAALTPSLVALATAYAECCADCEQHRTSGEPPPNPKWQAAWDRRMRLQGQLLALAMQFTDRETRPPELR
jgi:hypothetical protein